MEHEDGTGRAQLGNNKIRMSALIGLACASKLHRSIVFEFWAITFNALRHNDPAELNRMAKMNEADILHYVRSVHNNAI